MVNSFSHLFITLFIKKLSGIGETGHPCSSSWDDFHPHYQFFYFFFCVIVNGLWNYVKLVIYKVGSSMKSAKSGRMTNRKGLLQTVPVNHRDVKIARIAITA